MANARRRRRSAAKPHQRLRERVLTAALAEAALSETIDRGHPDRARHDMIGGVHQAYVVDRVELLYRAHQISRDHRDACRRLQRDYLLGVERVSEPPSAARGGSAEPDAGELRFLLALERYRCAVAAVGRNAAAMLEMLVCREATWEAIAAITRCDEATARAVAVLCIKDLAAYYQKCDGSKKAA